MSSGYYFNCSCKPEEVDWKAQFAKEHALRIEIQLDFENKMSIYDREIIIKDEKIKQLEAQIPKAKKIIFVVCGNYDQFKQYVAKNVQVDNIKHVYVAGAITLRGCSNPTVIFHGNWIEHPTILDIITQIKIATRK